LFIVFFSVVLILFILLSCSVPLRLTGNELNYSPEHVL
jgi:hypothetical protein